MHSSTMPGHHSRRWLAAGGPQDWSLSTAVFHSCICACVCTGNTKQNKTKTKYTHTYPFHTVAGAKMEWLTKAQDECHSTDEAVVRTYVQNRLVQERGGLDYSALTLDMLLFELYRNQPSTVLAQEEEEDDDGEEEDRIQEEKNTDALLNELLQLTLRPAEEPTVAMTEATIDRDPPMYSSGDVQVFGKAPLSTADWLKYAREWPRSHVAGTGTPLR
jgi:hypothetical protein